MLPAPRVEIRFCGRSWPAFQVCGLAGAVLGFALALVLAARTGLSVWLMAGLALASIGTFLSLAMATKIVTGRENLVYYHHEIAVIVGNGLLLRLIHRPVLPYLDLTILGIGAFLVCGRIGCLLVGCCHGRPSRWGIRYGKSHVDAGFTNYYEGVRLFPVQAMESAAVLLIVLTGAYLVLQKAPPGTALGWYAISYNAVRFVLEFLRGDPERPYLAGSSEPQWIALGLSLAVSLAELFGWLPLYRWHLTISAAMLGVTAANAFLRRRPLLAPRHVREIAAAVARLDRPPVTGLRPAPGGIPVSQTSLGVCISASKLRQPFGWVDYYALSCRNGGLTEKEAKKLAALISSIRRTAGVGQLMPGNSGVYHVTMQPAQTLSRK